MMIPSLGGWISNLRSFARSRGTQQYGVYTAFFFLGITDRSHLECLAAFSAGEFYFSLWFHRSTWAVLENRILPSLYRSRKHSEKDVSSVVIHCRKFFSHFHRLDLEGLPTMLHFLIDGTNRSFLPLTRLPSLNQVPFCPATVEQVESKYSRGSATLDLRTEVYESSPM